MMNIDETQQRRRWLTGRIAMVRRTVGARKDRADPRASAYLEGDNMIKSAKRASGVIPMGRHCGRAHRPVDFQRGT